MSTSATGNVVDLEGKGIAGLNIDIEDVAQVHDGRVLNDKPFVTDDSGDFTFTFPAYDFDTSQPGAQGRKFQLTIRIGRLVLKQVTSDEEL